MKSLFSGYTLAKPTVSKLILKSFPIFKKRTAWWFFLDDIRNNRTQVDKEILRQNNCDLTGIDLSTAKTRTIGRVWQCMPPEMKWRYYNMQIFDVVRYKEQKSLWITKVYPVLNKPDQDIKSLRSALPSEADIENEAFQLLERYQRNYEQLIKTQSACKLVEDYIKQPDIIPKTITKEQVLASLPEECRPIVEMPKKPPKAFQLFLMENKDKIKRIKRKNSSKFFLKEAGQIWQNLKPKERQKYQDQYDRDLSEYLEAMKKFRYSKASKTTLPQVAKERNSFNKSIRRKLRLSGVIPIHVRNGFNYFLKANRKVPFKTLAEWWDDLDEEEREKFENMSRQDSIRYQVDKANYVKLIDDILFQLLPSEDEEEKVIDAEQEEDGSSNKSSIKG